MSEKALTSKGKEIIMERGQVLFNDDSEGRVYNNKSKSKRDIENQYPSSTTIIDKILDIGAKEKLEQWSDKKYKQEDLLKWYQARGI